MKVLYVIIHYSNIKNTIEACNSLDDFDEEYLVVDISVNSELRGLIENIVIASNKGYLGSFLDAVSFDRNCTHYALCNNDLIFKKIKYPIGCENTIIAPSIITDIDKEQNPHRLYPLKKSEKIYFKIYFLNFYLAVLLRYIKGIRTTSIQQSKINSGLNIYSPHGACVLLPKMFTKKLQVNGPISFMYGEEILISHLAKEQSIPIMYWSDIEVYHIGGSSVGDFSRWKYEEQRKTYKEANRLKIRFYE